MSAKQPKYRLVNNKIIVALCLNLLSPGGFGSKILGTDNLSGCIVMVDIGWTNIRLNSTEILNRCNTTIISLLDGKSLLLEEALRLASKTIVFY